MPIKKTSFATVRNNFRTKINSYQVLLAQTSGGASKFTPSPTQLNSFSRWIDKGAKLQRVSATQLNRWAGTSKSNWSATTAKSTLVKKFGKSCIKAVACNKTGGFIVATSSVRNGRTFNFAG